MRVDAGLFTVYYDPSVEKPIVRDEEADEKILENLAILTKYRWKSMSDRPFAYKPIDYWHCSAKKHIRFLWRAGCLHLNSTGYVVTCSKPELIKEINPRGFCEAVKEASRIITELTGFNCKKYETIFPCGTRFPDLGVDIRPNIYPIYDDFYKPDREIIGYRTDDNFRAVTDLSYLSLEKLRELKYRRDLSKLGKGRFPFALRDGKWTEIKEAAYLYAYYGCDLSSKTPQKTEELRTRFKAEKKAVGVIEARYIRTLVAERLEALAKVSNKKLKFTEAIPGVKRRIALPYLLRLIAYLSSNDPAERNEAEEAIKRNLSMYSYAELKDIYKKHSSEELNSSILSELVRRKNCDEHIQEVKFYMTEVMKVPKDIIAYEPPSFPSSGVDAVADLLKRPYATSNFGRWLMHLVHYGSLLEEIGRIEEVLQPYEGFLSTDEGKQIMKNQLFQNKFYNGSFSFARELSLAEEILMLI